MTWGGVRQNYTAGMLYVLNTQAVRLHSIQRNYMATKTWRQHTLWSWSGRKWSTCTLPSTITRGLYTRTQSSDTIFFANFSGLYARLRMDDKVRRSNPGHRQPTWQTRVEHYLHMFVYGCPGTCFAGGMASPGNQSWEDCCRDHSGAISFRALSHPSVSPKCYLPVTLVPRHTLELLNDLPMLYFSILMQTTIGSLLLLTLPRSVSTSQKQDMTMSGLTSAHHRWAHWSASSAYSGVESTLRIASNNGVFSVSVLVFQPADNIRSKSRSLFRENLLTRRSFPKLEMSHLTVKSQTSRQRRLSAESQTWTASFGNCTFSGDYTGAPLVRTGSCPTHGGTLDLRSKGITSVQPNAFHGMSNITCVHSCVYLCGCDCSHNCIFPVHFKWSIFYQYLTCICTCF